METSIAANKDLIDLIKWGSKNSILFNPSKIEVIYFSRKIKERGVNPIIYHNGIYKKAELGAIVTVGFSKG
jgi:hypothetical protein